MPSSSEALRLFQSIPRFPLLHAPTPVEPCHRLSAALGGKAEIYIKRDDFTGYFVGGNKVRKLEYTMASVLAEKATAVVTIGSFQSNHARITGMVARRLGLKCVLVLNGEPPARPTGNYLITKMLGIDVVPVASREERRPMMEEIARDLTRRGERVVMIPLGASDDTGSFGLTAGFAEFVEQVKETPGGFSAIYVGSSSGGTQAGLEVGKRLFGRDSLRIVGVSPDDPAASISSIVTDVAGRMLRRLGLEPGFGPGEVVVDDAHIGAGYGAATDGAEEATRIFAATEGILLDPVYTSKVGAALVDACRKGTIKPGESVLFWHTGGLVGLFK